MCFLEINSDYEYSWQIKATHNNYYTKLNIHEITKSVERFLII